MSRHTPTPPATSVPADRRYLLERVDEAAVVQVYADGFRDLTLRDKLLVWHLYRAAIAGRDIFYDQRYAHNLEMRDVLEAIVGQEGLEGQDGVLAEVRRYTKLFWINSGPYNNLTARKFVLACTPAAFSEAAHAAQAAGAVFPRRGGESLDALLARLQPMFFDEAFEPTVTCKTPPPGEDILSASANNMYAGVTMADLDGFAERYALNSRLVKRDQALVEEVYRVGGRYSAPIAAIVEHLEAAMRYAPAATARALRALVSFYKTGEDADRAAYDVAWVQDRDSTVDTINGFVEVYQDARSIKGAWEAIVSYVNAEKTSQIRTIAAHAQWFEERMPWDPKYRKEGAHGVTANAIDVVIETGESGPITPVGINLPNDQGIRERFGSKSVSLSNINEAYEQSTLPEFRREFSWSAEEFERAMRWTSFAGELTTNMHEVIGHGSGKVAARLGGSPQSALKEHFSAIEEARADLVALYFLPDRRLVDLGLLASEDHDEIVRAEYEAYARNALVQLRRVRQGTTIEEDHMRNRQLIVGWLMANTTAIDVRRRDGKTYYVMADPEAFRQGVARLLADVRRIKAEGDYDAAKALVDAHGVYFDAALRDEIVARVDHLHLPSYTGFVMPRLDPVVDAAGDIVDVAISYPCDLTAQMLEVLRGDAAVARDHVEAGPEMIRTRLPLLALLVAGAVAPAAAQTTRLAVLQAEDRRAPTAADLATIRSGARSGEAQVARVGVRALGRLERPALIADILPALRHAVPEVRADAANAIGQAAQGWKREKPSAAGLDAALAALAARLKVDADPDVRAAIAETIGRLPYTEAAQADKAEQVLVDLDGRSESVADRLGVAKGFEALLRISRKLRDPSEEALALLRRYVTAGGAEATTGARVRRLALEALLTVATADQPSIRTAVTGAAAAAVGDKDAQVRRLALRAAPADAVATALHDDSPIVRIEALRQLQAKGLEVCPPSIAAAADRDTQVALVAIDQLAACGSEADAMAVLDRAVTDLSDAGSPRAWHRAAHALVALAAANLERGAAVLGQFTGSRVWQLRLYAARAAATLRNRAALERFARDDDDNVREAAVEALKAQFGHDADPLFVEQLTRPGNQVVRAAAAALVDTPNGTAAIPALKTALDRLIAEGRDNSHDARDAIGKALTSLGEKVPAVRPRAVDRPSDLNADDLRRLAAPRARVTIRGVGAFELALFTAQAPATVLRFARLAESGYYNGLTFHRVVPNFVIQGGSPGANEYIGDASFMRDELGLWPHVRGAVGISTRGRDTGDAQIFVDLVDNPRLDHEYTVFAQVLNGIDVVDRVLEGDVIERIEIIF